ncbi:MAG: GTPase ObgE, partial [Spirochaetota bacterium]
TTGLFSRENLTRAPAGTLAWCILTDQSIRKPAGCGEPIRSGRRSTMSQFVDEADITVVSGKGGPGAVSFRREKYVPRGGPDGGDGGDGGDVVIQVEPGLRTLYELQLRKVIRARNGAPGGGSNRKGSDGDDAVVRVPAGTVVIDKESGTVLADLTEEGRRFLAAEGGRGGRGNARFATSVRQAPRFAQPGLPGTRRELALQVKFIADVGLVGLPNAGKSTLLSVLTRARPKIGAYPFTTLTPNLGVMRWHGDREYVIADIPGLIEGASRGQGLGIRFLKHIERTRVLLFLLDMNQGDLHHQYRVLAGELRSYTPALMDKPKVVVGSKSDAASPGSLDELREDRWEEHTLAVSSVTGDGIEELKRHIAALAGNVHAGTPS